MFIEHLLYARHCEAPKHNSDLEDQPISSCFLCSVVSVDTGKKDYGSSVKEDFLEVASRWSVEVSEGGEPRECQEQPHVCIKQHVCVGEGGIFLW